MPGFSRCRASGLVIALALTAFAGPVPAQTLQGGVTQDYYNAGAGSRGNTTYPTGSQSHQPNDAPCNNPYGCGRGYGQQGGISANPSGDVYCQRSPDMPMYGPYSHTGPQTPCNLPSQAQAPQSPPINGCWTNMPNGKLCVQDGVFRDQNGNVVILRGINLAGTSKTPPFLPLPAAFAPPPNSNHETRDFDFLGNSDLSPIARMPGLGFNVIRLIFVWEAYEPVEGQRNPAYIAMLRAIISRAWQYHIYTVVDFHQDAFARTLAQGCGEGFPRWTIPRTIGPLDTPDNSVACADWMMIAAKDSRVHAAFSALYHSDLRRKYLQVANDLVSQLCGEPGVIGFDPLNEPFSDPTGWGPPVDGSSGGALPTERELASLYQSVAGLEAVRRTRPILFLEPNLIVDTGLTTNLPKPQGYSQVAYAPHYYDPQTTAKWLNKFIAPGPTTAALQRMQKIAGLWNAPLFIGEFGAAIDTGNAQGYMNTLHDEFNRTLASAAQWSFTPGWTAGLKDGWNGEDLSIVAPVQTRSRLFRPRPYPQQTAGVPKSLQVTYPKGDTSLAYTMTYTWQPQQTTTNTTVFFLPQYPGLDRVAQSGGALQAGCLAAVNPFGSPDFQRMVNTCLGQPQIGGPLQVEVRPAGAVNCSTRTYPGGVIKLMCEATTAASAGLVQVVVSYNGWDR